MESNPILSLSLIGGLAFATAFIPFRGIKRWSWEIYWLILSFAAWLIAPAILTTILVPRAWSALGQTWHSDSSAIIHALLWGIVWGIGAICFGLAIRYLGIALGYTLSLGIAAIFGVVFPLSYSGTFSAMLHSGAATFLLAGLAVCLIGVLLTAASAASKDQEFTLELKLEAGERDFAFGKGLVLSVIAGIALTFVLFGLHAAHPITALVQSELAVAVDHEKWAAVPALFVVLVGGFLINAVWSIFMIVGNDFSRQFTGEPGLNPLRGTATAGNTLVDFDPLDPSTYDRVAPRTLVANYLLAALAGVLWYLHLLLYSAVQSSTANTAISTWLLAIASAVFFASLWGLVLREWNGTSNRTKGLAFAGAALIVASCLLIVFGSNTPLR